MTDVLERQAGARVTAKGLDVLVSMNGVPGDLGEAEILISVAEARRLALRLLDVAEEQQRQREELEAAKERLGL